MIGIPKKKKSPIKVKTSFWGSKKKNKKKKKSISKRLLSPRKKQPVKFKGQSAAVRRTYRFFFVLISFWKWFSKGPAEETAVSEPSNLVLGRMKFVFVGCGILATVLISRAVYIQVIGDSRLAEMHRKQFQSKVLLRPRRGLIVDRNGEPLAVNIKTRSIAANPEKIKNKKKLASKLGKIVGVSSSKLLKRFRSNREFVWVKRHLSEPAIKKLKKEKILGSHDELPAGLWMVKENRRVYPHREVAAHVLGDVNLDLEGLEGVELWYNNRLQGDVISFIAVRDALGRPTFIDATAERHMKNGQPVVLSIDASLQFKVEKLLQESVKKHKARAGTVLVMNATNGEILAMANQPSFNPNLPAIKPENRRNRIVTDGYEPGSTLKPLLLASALSNGWKPRDLVWGEKGSFVVQGRRISEAEADEKFEWLTLEKMIQVSSNVGAAKVAMKLGPKSFVKTLRDFGFAKKTGIEFPGEISGWLPKDGKIQPLTLANMGFGQGLFATRLQLARAFAAVLNGGLLVSPRLVRSPFKNRTDPKRVLSSDVARKVRVAMLKVTQPGGTGENAAVKGYRIAGKTGTAQVVDSATKQYSKTRYIASFVGFAVGIQPKIVILTSIDGPKGVYYGSQTAAPLFKSVFSVVANRLSLPADPKLQTVDPVLARAKKISDKIRLSASHSIPTKMVRKLETVPRLHGLTSREVFEIFKGKEVLIQMKGFGLVQKQFPPPGTALKAGLEISLQLVEP